MHGGFPCQKPRTAVTKSLFCVVCCVWYSTVATEEPPGGLLVGGYILGEHTFYVCSRRTGANCGTVEERRLRSRRKRQ